jgi:hypothetical protein
MEARQCRKKAEDRRKWGVLREAEEVVVLTLQQSLLRSVLRIASSIWFSN